MGHNYSEAQKKAVWAKRKLKVTAKTGYDRYDLEIHQGEYGKQSKYGWNVDHIKPEAQGGKHELSNWQPLHWVSNMVKADIYKPGRKLTLTQLIHRHFNSQFN